MNKLIDMLDDKCQIFDSIIEKISAGTFTKKVVISLDSSKKSESGAKKMETSEEYEKVFAPSSKSSKFEIISEEIDEDEVIEIIEKEESTSKMQSVVYEEEKSQKLKLAIQPLDLTFKSATPFKATCHTWFIVKDKGVDIDWRKPLLQRS